MASSRTRSKKATQFCSLPLRGSIFGKSKRGRRRKTMQENEGEPRVPYISLSSSEEEDEGVSVLRSVTETDIRGDIGAAVTTEGKQRRRSGLKGKRVAESDVVFMGECVDTGEFGSGFGTKRKRKSVGIVIIDDSDDDNGTEMGKQVPVHVVDVKEEQQDMDVDVKGENFGHGGCDRGGPADEERVVVVSSSENADSGSDSEKNGFQGFVGGGEGDKSEGGEMCSEFEDQGPNFHSDGCGWAPGVPIVINLDANLSEDESSEAQSGSAGDEDVGDDIGSSSESEDENSSDEDFRAEEVSGSNCESSSSDESSSYDDDNEKRRRGRPPRCSGCSGCSRPCNDQAHEVKKKQDSSKFHGNVLLPRRTRDSTKVDKSERVDNSERNSPIADANDSVIGDLGTQGGGEEHHDKKGFEKKVDNVLLRKRTRVATKVDNSERVDNSDRNSPIADAKDSVIGDLGTQGGGDEHHGKNGFEEKDDDIHPVDTPLRAYEEKPPLKRNFMEDEPLEKSESKEELDNLWAEMDLGLRSDDEGSVVRIASSLPRKRDKMGRGSAKLADTNDRVNANLGSQGGEDHHGKGSVVRNVSSLPRKQEKLGESAEHKIVENGGRVCKDRINTSNHEKKAWVDKRIGNKDGHHRVHRMPLKRKEQRLLDLLAECLLGKQKETKGDRNGFEEQDDDNPQVDTRSPAYGEKPPLKWNIKEAEPLKKSASEEELDNLWAEMDLQLRLEEINSPVGIIGKNEGREKQTFICKHDFRLDDEIGEICRKCSWVATDIKYVWPPVVDEIPSKRSRNRVLSGVDDVFGSYDARFNASDGDKGTVSPQNEGTVWDLIPDVKQSLYPHQQEGFEFIWTNLAGTLDRHSLKTADPSSAGGCIISHAPGTGKTRLTIVFLQTYLEVFPKCRPVIIAPASILNTWEDEFKKWNIGVPFHNLNTPELSGKEHCDATQEVDCYGSLHKNKDAVRMAKLYSWFREKSILGISYQLYEKLAGGNSKKKNRNMGKEKKHVSMNENPEAETSVLEKVLLEVPGLLVLDEGHTPRNQRSSIWNVLSRIQTQKRIILSGTPFQNNFVELYNTLCLVKPSFPDMIPPELKKFCQSRLMQERKTSQDFTWEQACPGNNTTGNPSDVKIQQLKLWMDPFVHVHKGSILQENLPGLRDCVLILKPGSLQKEILESIESSQNLLNFEHKLALASVHPSLFLCCTLTEKEKSVVDRDQLEKLQFSPYEGAKTRFLVEFVRLCEAVNEKVLVFSQFIDPLNLIMDQLKSNFDWIEGQEVVCMSGKLDQKKKQQLIHGFNDEKSRAKVLLASTKACSEGINLVGASRVVLLDVVWNPSVERQAISRAYRLGQKKVVYTYHLITQDTAESAKYCKQAEKDRISELVFSDRNAENDRSKSGAVNIEDNILDMMKDHDKLKDLFGECVVQPKEKYLIESFGP